MRGSPNGGGEVNYRNPNVIMLNLAFGLLIGNFVCRYMSGVFSVYVLVAATALVVAALLGYAHQWLEGRRLRRMFLTAARKDQILLAADPAVTQPAQPNTQS